MIECKCTTWATDDLTADLLGNGHNHTCQHYKPNVGAVELLAALVKGIDWWASQEDGIPDELWDAYARAVFVTSGKALTEVSR